MARGDILYVDLPKQDTGREQAGRRPVLAVQADLPTNTNLPTLLVVPMTSNLNAARFAHTVAVTPSPANGLVQESVLLVFQLRAVDRRRIGKRIGTLEPHYMTQLEDELRGMLGL